MEQSWETFLNEFDPQLLEQDISTSSDSSGAGQSSPIIAPKKTAHPNVQPQPAVLQGISQRGTVVSSLNEEKSKAKNKASCRVDDDGDEKTEKRKRNQMAAKKFRKKEERVH